MSAFLFLSILLLSNITQNDVLSPQEIINKSIEYHDPKGILLEKATTLHLTETRPNGKDRKSTISIDIKKERFEMDQLIEEHKIVSTYSKGIISFSVNGSSEISDELKEKYRLKDDRLKMLRNYYQYLWLLPLKLNDAGTILNPTVKSTDFFGKKSLAIQVTYDAEVGNDIWYFYFHPVTYALQGYRFYHDESDNDGEYILLNGETEFKSVRLPKERKWYTHKEDKYLGADILDAFNY